MFDLEDERESLMSIDEAAELMGRTPEEVRRLIRLRLLATRCHRGDLLVRPSAVTA